MFPLLLQTIISNQMRPRSLRGDSVRKAAQTYYCRRAACTTLMQHNAQLEHSGSHQWIQLRVCVSLQRLAVSKILVRSKTCKIRLKLCLDSTPVPSTQTNQSGLFLRDDFFDYLPPSACWVLFWATFVCLSDSLSCTDCNGSTHSPPRKFILIDLTET